MTRIFAPRSLPQGEASSLSHPKSASSLLEPRLPRAQNFAPLSRAGSSNPITALVLRIQDSPSATAVVLGSMGALTLMSMAPREAVAATDLGYESEVASAELDANERELRDKIASLVEGKFGGDYRAAFNHYDADGDGGVNRKELITLLEDANIGTFFTRGGWANEVLKKIDKRLGNNDGQVQWPEFQRVLASFVKLA